MIETDFHWLSAWQTNKGLVRSINEDACLASPEQGVWVVADGMGGHAAGDLASRMVIKNLQAAEPASSLGDLVDDIRARLREVNLALRSEAARRGGEIIGSTVAALLTYHSYCVYLWAGDSRVYLFRRGRLKQLSRDHSQVEELIEQGILTPEQAANHPTANYITRAVGADDHLELDAEIMEIRENDIFLLCSDGLTREVSDQEIGMKLNDEKPLQTSVNELIDCSLRRGAHDNVTVILAQARSAASAPE